MKFLKGYGKTMDIELEVEYNDGTIKSFAIGKVTERELDKNHKVMRNKDKFFWVYDYREKKWNLILMDRVKYLSTKEIAGGE